MDARQSVKRFLQGEIDIVTFREMYDKQPPIDAFLQSVVDELERTGSAVEPVSVSPPGASR